MATNSNRNAPGYRLSAKKSEPEGFRLGKREIGIAGIAIAVALMLLGLLRTEEPADPVAAGSAAVSESGATGQGTTGLLPPNRPPVIKQAQLVPKSPDASSRIAVKIDSSDPDGDAVRYDVTWYRNGTQVQGPPLQVFPEGVAARGDRIRAEVIATDGIHRTKPHRTASVTVGNLPPAATGVELSPQPLVPGESLEAKPVGSDPDGDTLRWRFVWTKNGRKVNEARDDVFPGNLVQRGDRIRVTVTPWDSSGAGSPFESEEVVAGNRAPRIASNPPTTLDGAKLEYAVQAEDPDGDPISFVLQGNVPEGMSISPAGVLAAELEKLAPGRYDVEIVASDPDGDTDIQSVTIKIPDKHPDTAAAE